MVVNLSSMSDFIYRQLNMSNKNKIKVSEQLSSGYKVNRAADNAASLSISEKMRGQIRGLERASENIQDGISFVQTTDGALSQMTAIIQRINELCVQGANDTNVTEDRNTINNEISVLRNELDHICETTQFNGIHPFRGYYSPTITSRPTDVRIWNIGSGASTKYGGIWYDDIRYTWDDFNSNPVGADGKLIKGDYSIKVKKKNDVGTYDEITLDFVVKSDGLEPNQIIRKYKMTADAVKGITIDNIVYSWDKIKNSNGIGLNPNNVAAGNYSFVHAGMNISFSIPAGSSILDVVSGINGDGVSVFDWKSDFTGVSNPQCVTIQGAYNYPINESNKDFVGYNPENGYGAGYYIVADSTGVTIRAANGETHNTNYTKMTWQDLGILTWDGENTVDRNKTYVYTEQNTGTRIAFKILPESSLEEVIKGLNGAPVNTTLLTPTTGTLTTSGSSTNITNLSYYSSSIKFSTQYDYGRDFDSSSWNFNKSGAASSIVINGNDLSFTFTNPDSPNVGSLTFSTNRGTIENSLYNTIRSGMLNGLNSITEDIDFLSGSDSITFRLNANIKNMKDSFTAERDTLLTQKVNDMYTIYYNNLTQAEKDQLTPADEANKRAQLRNTYKSSVSNDLINSSKYVTQINTYASNTYTEFSRKNCKLNLTTNGTASYTTFNSSALYSPVQVTSFGVVTNDVIRVMNIQAGANAGQNIRVPLMTLNSNVLALVGTNVNNFNNASAAIDKVKDALAIISSEQSKYGALQNRLEYAMNNDDNSSENLQAAESRIRDVDIAENMVEMSKLNIISQVAEAVMAQANNSNRNILKLFE